MPTFNSVNYANQIGGQVRNRLESNVICQERRTANLEYAFVGTEASGDILKLGQLPPGVTIMADEIKLQSEGIGGTTVTFTAIGDQQTANRYTTTAVPLTAATAGAAITPVVANTIPPVVITKDVNDVIQGTLGGTLPATAGKRIWLRVPYNLV
jgi:hypothetical protein